MNPDPFAIASRKAFRASLADARAAVQRLAEAEPKNPNWFYVAAMLDAMAAQTAGSREPTLDERRGATLGAIVDRELEPAPNADLAALNEQLKSLHLYFMVWPDDGVDPELMPEEELIARL